MVFHFLFQLFLLWGIFFYGLDIADTVTRVTRPYFSAVSAGVEEWGKDLRSLHANTTFPVNPFSDCSFNSESVLFEDDPFLFSLIATDNWLRCAKEIMRGGSIVGTSVSRNQPRSVVTIQSRRSRARLTPSILARSQFASVAGGSRRRKKQTTRPPRSSATWNSSNSAMSKFSAVVTQPAGARAYWDAIGHRIPPNIATTFGNFTCVNSLSRFSYTTNVNAYTQFIFCVTPSAIRTFAWASATLSPGGGVGWVVWQQQQLSANNTVPLDIRPLRQSVRMRNTTQNLNIAGAVTTVLVPQSLVATYIASNSMNAATISSFWGFANNNPSSKTFSGKELTKSHTFVQPPSSFVAYNSYLDWIPVSAPPTSDSGGALAATDFNSLFLPNTLPTYPITASKGVLGDIPSNYFLMVNLEPNGLAQTYEFEVFAQDGIRYPANSMAAAVGNNLATAGGTLTEGVVAHSAAAAANDNVHPSDSVSQVGINGYVSRAAAGLRSGLAEEIGDRARAAESVFTAIGSGLTMLSGARSVMGRRR